MENKKIPLSEYPRPQLKRDSYMCLNGQWKLSFLDENKTLSYNITVPYCLGSEASGVERTLKKNELMLYTCNITFNEEVDFEKERLLLHFGAVSNVCSVFVDGEIAAQHSGGFLPFTVEVKKKSFRLDVMANEKGIWQTVWMEKVPKSYIKNVITIPDLTGFDIVVVSEGSESLPCIISFGLKKYEITSNTVCRIDIPHPQLWTPQSPNLYHFSVTMEEDKVFSYVGLRTFSAENGKLFLNNKPLFHHGIANYGFFEKGVYTPLEDCQMIKDIMFAKQLGFNTIRMTNKVESLLWYYHCDSLGILVWQDLFGNQIPEIVQTLYNSASIAMWTLFNVENIKSKRLEDEILSFDRTRTIERNNTIVSKDKSIFSNIRYKGKKIPVKKENTSKIQILTDCGNYSLVLEESTSNSPDSEIKTKGDLTCAIEKFYREKVFPAKDQGLAGSIYFKLTDVENDSTGLLSLDRKSKVVPEDISIMSEELLK